MTEPKELAETIWFHIPGWFGNLDTARKVVSRFLPNSPPVEIEPIARELVALGEENRRKFADRLTEELQSFRHGRELGSDLTVPEIEDEPYDPIETDRDELDLTWLRTMMTIAGCACLGSALVILIASGWWAALYF